MKKLLTFFLLLVASVGTMFAWDYERVQIGDLYYNLDGYYQTAEVTSQNSSDPYWSTTITTAIIPASVEYNSVPYYVTSIGDDAFNNCGLTSVTIPNSVTSIGYYAFSYCSSLTSIEIPNSVTSIGSNAFEGCTDLTSVTIPNSVTSIGDFAFYWCSGLTSIEIPNSVTSIGELAFSRCSSLTSVTIPNSVTSIGDQAFLGCSSLTYVTIPNRVTSIGGMAFYDCSSLTALYVATDNPYYCSEDGVLFNKDKTTLIQYPGGKQGAYAIPNSVTNIGDRTFASCTGLTSVTIPNSVTSIGDFAFWGCSSLTSVTISNTVKSIGILAFFKCSGLTSITCEATTPPALDSGVFNIVDKSIPLYVPAQSVDLYKAADQWKDFTNILPITSSTPQTFTITFLNYDGSELQSSEVEAGTMPQYNGATPTRPADAQYTYTFAGWDKEIATVTANATYTATFEAIAVGGGSTGGIGLFSVSATQQVTFAPGNLQYQASTNTWRFAEHQWDMVGMGYGQTNTDEACYIGGTVANSDNRNISSSYNGWIDLFGWGTGNAPTKSSMSYSDYSTFVDWGTNAISNGGNQANMWRTLTNDEWNYLFSSRANASSKYGVGMVNGINGMIVLPDEFTLPSGLTFNAGVASSSGYQYYQTKNNYSASEWARMEACGALFLPAAGLRMNSSVGSVGSGGGYWSSTPSGTSNAYYRYISSHYTFWDYYDRLVGRSVRLALAAQGEQEPVYSLTISVEGEGTVIGAGEYKNGTTATLTATPASGYLFSQWSDGNTDNPRTITMTQDMTLTAVFVKKTFLVSFLNYDGTELQSSEVNYGETPVYTGATPTKPADEQYTYSFNGWDAELVAVTGEATYTAQFTSTLNKYAITFVNYDGSELQNSEVAYGETPVYTGETPTKPADAQYTYSFSGWTPEVVAVAGEATYTAQFTSTLNKYAVTFVNYDGSELQNSEVEFGETPVYTGETPTIPADEQYTYSFNGWTPEIVAVTGEATYTAVFESIVISQDTTIIHNGETPDIGDITDPNIVIEQGGELNVNVDVNWWNIRLGVITIVTTGGQSGQIHNAETFGNWRIFLEYKLNPLGSTASPNLWYAFAVPFEVDIETGITRAYGKKSHVPGVDFQILEYDGMLRATTGKGWVKKDAGSLEPGTFYMIGIEGNCNRWLFEKKSDADIQGDSHVNLNQYFAGNSDNGKHNGWNGKGNSRLEYSEMDLSGITEFIYLYNNEFGKFELTAAAGIELCVGQPFFVQASADASFDFVHNGGTHPMPALRAPQSAMPQMHFTLTSDQMHVGTDHMYVTMHEDASTTYTIGRDVARMSMNCQTAAQLWCLSADGTELAAHDIALPETETVIPIGLFAPKDGEYLLNRSERATDDFEVELLYNGTYAATLFADQPLVLNLKAGTTTDYSLRIHRRMPTDLENTAAKLGGSQKILHDGHLYILQGEHIFDAQGKLVK